jgi:5-methylcytosine-specific restriction endonuclease McrA
MQGNNHPRWKGGPVDRGSNWCSQRRQALRRDKHTCQICGRKPKKGEKRIVDVHHIIPYREFHGDYLKANHLPNLITLCKSCHAAVEHHRLPCPQRLF